MVKLTFTLVLLAVAATSKGQNNFIRFDHIGESDKPINSLIISIDKIEIGDFETLLIVKKALFERITRYVLKNKTKDKNPLKKDYGVFKISVHGSDNVEYFLTTRAASLKFFKHLKFDLDTDKGDSNTVSKELELLIKRITF